MKNRFFALCAAMVLMLAASCGNNAGNGNNASNEATKPVEVKTVKVSNAREFLEAIGSNKNIIIEKEFDGISAELTKMVKEGKVKEKGILEPIQPEADGCISATATDEGYSLNIVSAENLSIAWESAEKQCAIEADPSDVNVMGFYHCKNVSIKGLFMGHKKQDGCSGDVVYLFGCNNITISYSSLFGCGVIGLNAAKSQNITVNQCGIFDCSAYGARLKDCENVTFNECAITQIGIKELDIYDTKNITFSKCEFEQLDSLVSGNVEAKDIVFKDCSLFRTAM